MNILELIDQKDLLSFSQNLSIQRNYVGDRLFPDTKTENLEAEYMRLTNALNLPTMALVHAFDSEAAIGSRPDIQKVTVEKLLIKEKINQSERLQLFLNSGAKENSLIEYVFDDAARLADSVKARTEVMKMDALSTGKITVNENNLKFSIDCGVPSDNKKSVDWSDTSADILGDIQAAVDAAKDKGYTPDYVLTTSKVLEKIRKNKGIQTAIYGTNGVGVFVDNARINQLFTDMFGVTIEINDARYQYETASGKKTTKRYVDEGKFVIVSTMNGTVGTGLWGVTPEEIGLGAYTAKSAQQYITITQWETADPRAVWTKASGVFIPVMPYPEGVVICDVKLA